MPDIEVENYDRSKRIPHPNDIELFEDKPPKNPVDTILSNLTPQDLASTKE